MPSSPAQSGADMVLTFEADARPASPAGAMRRGNCSPRAAHSESLRIRAITAQVDSARRQ